LPFTEIYNNELCYFCCFICKWTLKHAAAAAADDDDDYLRVFQDNWVYVSPRSAPEEPDGELASSLTQLAHRCIASLNKVRCKIILIRYLLFNGYSVECCCAQPTVSA